jgi:hypothetical protein
MDRNTFFEDCPPRADAMVNSLRAFGYDLSKAIADLIDNSIYANSKNIEIKYGWNEGSPWILIQDDGDGMSEERLKEAMRLGSQNPSEERNPNDLGRFGLGLKSASFSQCKLLTVKTKIKSGKESIRYWDIDHIQTSKKWEIGKISPAGAKSLLKSLDDLNSGTIVLWQNLDKVVDLKSTNSSSTETQFYKKFLTVSSNLEMIFHRFLRDSKSGISIIVGQHKCLPWDPYLQKNDFTQILSSEKYEDGRISIIPFVLPHVSNRSNEETNRGAGPMGWNAQQGFYVYRNKRMIISGGYLDFDIKPEEHYKLCRIMLDISNDMDHEWNLDVRKAFASPPDNLRSDLLRIAKATRNEAANIYRARTGRGRIKRNPRDLSNVWVKKRIGNKIVYRINADNEVLKEILIELSPAKKWISKLFHTIETTVPHRLIIMDNAELEDCHIDIPFNRSQPPESMLKLCEAFFNNEINNRRSASEAIDLVTAIEPFDTHPAYRIHLERLLESEEQ